MNMGLACLLDAIERDSMLSEIVHRLLPFLEDFFDDIQNIVVRILRETEGVEFNSSNGLSH